MNRQQFKIGLWIIGITICGGNFATAQDAGYAELKGNWQAVEMVDNGRAIATAAIPGWLPSGGRIEIVNNSIVFTSPKDGQRYARVFSIDATTYPRQLNVIDGGKVSGQGIYRIDDGRLVVCLTPSNGVPRPTEFSAREGSMCVMIVFKRADPKLSVPTAPVAKVAATTVPNLPAPAVINAPSQSVVGTPIDVEISKLLPGIWKCKDAYGAFFLSLDKNGTYSTYRESVQKSVFQKVFTKMPLSSGTWTLKNGQVTLQCTSAVYADRLYKSFPFTIRAVSSKEMQFVDYAGNVGKAERSKH